MVYLLKTVIFHGYVSQNQMVYGKPTPHSKHASNLTLPCSAVGLGYSNVQFIMNSIAISNPP